MTATILDLRSKQTNPPRDGVAACALDRHGKWVIRDPRKVTGVTLHQTACLFGKAPDQPDRFHRALNVHAHVTAFGREQVVAVAYPLLAYVYHGNGFNSEDVGLETEGRFPGLLDDPATVEREDLLSSWGGKADPVSAADVETVCFALRWIVGELRALGATPRYLHAHRQSSGTRRSDPGQGLWTPVVNFARKELGLVTQNERTLIAHDKQGRPSPGRPIPKQWDPVGGVGSY